MVVQPTHAVIRAQDAADLLSDDSVTSGDWIRAGSILVGSIVLAVIVSRLLRRIIAHGIGPGFASIMMARLAGYATFLVGLFYSLSELGVRVGPLIGALGLGGLVLALALQRFVENFVSSIILQARRPFTVGDTVLLDGRIGTVADIDSRVTVLDSLDGTQVRVPNSNVVSATIENLTRQGVRRSSMDVGVAYATDLQAARSVIEDALTRVPRVLDDPPPAVHVTGFHDSSIGLVVLYWHASDVPSELAARTDLAIAIHQGLAAAGITIAFPQMVVWPGAGDDVQYETVDEIVRTDQPGPASDTGPGQRRRTGPRLPRPRRRGTS